MKNHQTMKRDFYFISNSRIPVRYSFIIHSFTVCMCVEGSYPIYIKGSNFIPMDAFVTRGTPQVLKRLLTSAIEGNQNMIRVW